jgi:hypothetical protein
MNRIDLSPIDVNDRHKPLGSRAVAQKQRDTHVPYICAYSILQTLENLSSDSDREKTIAKNRISILEKWSKWCFVPGESPYSGRCWCIYRVESKVIDRS